MTRFLAWIFFIFGGLALGIMSFFFMQNKNDLMTAWDHKEGLSYDNLVVTCQGVEKKYYYPCFRDRLLQYFPQVGLTGTSLGLKLAFNMIDEDRDHTTFFSSEFSKDLNYSLNYLELNNDAVVNSYKTFHGFEVLYSGYIGSLQDFLTKASEFHDNIVIGLKGDKGILTLKDENQQKELLARLDELVEAFKKEHKLADDFVQREKKIIMDAAAAKAAADKS